MRLFGDAKVLQGSVAWTNPLRLKIAVLPQPVEPAQPPAAATPAVPTEFDEDGRAWVFRFARVEPQRYAVDRDRLFEYMKKHRLPREGHRKIRRDMRNRADFFTDVRELQTHFEAEPLDE
jgi:hypothetical protein